MALTRSARRWIVGGVAASALIAVLVGAEGISRAVIQPRLNQSAPTGVHMSLSGSAAWGLLTGSLGVSLRLGEDVLAAALRDRVDDVWIDDRIHVSISRSTPIGDVPLDVALVPEVAAGELTVEVVEVNAGGIFLSPQLIERGLALDQVPVESSCLELHDASVQDGALILHGDIPTGLVGTQGC